MCESYDKSVDMWGIGIITYILLAGTLTFFFSVLPGKFVSSFCKFKFPVLRLSETNSVFFFKDTLHSTLKTTPPSSRRSWTPSTISTTNVGTTSPILRKILSNTCWLRIQRKDSLLTKLWNTLGLYVPFFWSLKLTRRISVAPSPPSPSPAHPSLDHYSPWQVPQNSPENVRLQFKEKGTSQRKERRRRRRRWSRYWTRRGFLKRKRGERGWAGGGGGTKRRF